MENSSSSSAYSPRTMVSASGSGGSVNPRLAAALASGLPPRLAAEMASSNSNSPRSAFSRFAHAGHGGGSLNPQAMPFAAAAQPLLEASSSQSNSNSSTPNLSGHQRTSLESVARSRLNRMINAAAAASNASSSPTSPFESSPLISPDANSSLSASGRNAVTRISVNVEDESESQDLSVEIQDWSLFSTPSESYLLPVGSPRNIPLSPTGIFQEPLSPVSTQQQQQKQEETVAQKINVEDCTSLVLQLEALEEQLIDFSKNMTESRSGELIDAMEAVQAIHDQVHHGFTHKWDSTLIGLDSPREFARFSESMSSSASSPAQSSYHKISSGSSYRSALSLEEHAAKIEAYLQELAYENEGLARQLAEM